MSGRKAWQLIANKLFRDASEARDRPCPSESFLGLCAEGLIKGVASTTAEQTESPNRRYAITAVRLLENDPRLAFGSKIGLWRRVMTELQLDEHKRPNEQMEVVLSLWRNDLIQTLLPA